MTPSTCSVVVATYNSSKTLEKCLQSIIEQTAKPELIVIDGGSTDGTQMIIDHYRACIAYTISEPDRGVFDAWNKALQQANGEWVSFMGCDDFYENTGALLQGLVCAEAAPAEVCFVYANIMRVSGGKMVNVGENADWGANRYRYPNNMPFTNVGCLHRKSLFERFGVFDPSFRIAGDFDFFSKVYHDNIAVYCPQFTVCMGIEGLSQSVNFRLNLLQEKKIIHERYSHKLRWVDSTSWIIKLIFFKAKNILQKCL